MSGCVVSLSDSCHTCSSEGREGGAGHKIIYNQRGCGSGLHRFYEHINDDNDGMTPQENEACRQREDLRAADSELSQRNRFMQRTARLTFEPAPASSRAARGVKLRHQYADCVHLQVVNAATRTMGAG